MRGEQGKQRGKAVGLTGPYPPLRPRVPADRDQSNAAGGRRYSLEATRPVPAVVIVAGRGLAVGAVPRYGALSGTTTALTSSACKPRTSIRRDQSI